MFCSVLIWTGNLIVISQVEAVGRQQQPAMQPCTNSTENFLGNPRGGICEAPVIHLMRSIRLTPSMPEVKKGELLRSPCTLGIQCAIKAGLNKVDVDMCVYGRFENASISYTTYICIPLPPMGKFPIMSMWETQGIAQLFQLIADEYQKFISVPRTQAWHEMMTLSLKNNFFSPNNFLQSNQVKHTPQDYITEFITCI